MTHVVAADLPGHELVLAGLADLAAGRETEAALVLAMAAARLRALGRSAAGRRRLIGCIDPPAFRRRLREALSA